LIRDHKLNSMKIASLLICTLIMACTNVIAQKSWQKVNETFLFKNPPFKECHASTLVETIPGTILAAWFAGKHEGHKEVGIWASFYNNGSWSKPKQVANGRMDANLTYALWNPVLFKSKSGKLFLYYKQGLNPREWWGMFKFSIDNGLTWSEAERLPAGVLGPIKNKPVELADGTLLSPSSTESLKDEWRVHMERSTDQGKTWKIIPVDHQSSYEVIQPTILIHDKRLQILSRSKQGHVIQSWSDDYGLTWTPQTPLSLLNPNSGIDAVTISNNEHIIVYNPTIPGNHWSNGRDKLYVAVSKDGENWTDILKLENGQSKEEFSYPAIIQSSDGKIHITYTYNRKNIKYVVLEKK
jgi:predicted neuraminidase